MLLILVACNGADDGPKPDDDPAPTGRTGDTGGTIPTPTGDTGGPPPVLYGCVLDPTNVLRAWCTTEEAATADRRVEVARDDGTDPRVFRPDPALGEGTLVWGLEPERSWSWRIVDEGAGVDLAGTFDTLALPKELRSVEVRVEVTDPSSEIDAVLFSPTCPSGYGLMADVDGDVIWYQDLHVGTGAGGSINALQWSEDRTVLAHASRMRVRELDLAGNVRFEAERGTDYEDYVHHDLYRKDGYTYDLRAREGTVGSDAVVIDGVYVFDGAGAVVEELDFEGLYPYQFQAFMSGGYWGGVFLGAIDFSHANSIQVDAAGDLLISFRHLSAFAKFQGGPGTPGFGTLLWTAVGDGGSAIAAEGDFLVSGPGDGAFQGQHDVNVLSDGSVLMLDNGFPLGQLARASRYALDEPGRTLTLLESWETGQSCPVLGGARELPGGHVLVTCDPTGTMFEFAPGRADPVWQAVVRCDTYVSAQIPRAIPVQR